MAEWYHKHRRLAVALQRALEHANALGQALEAKAQCTLPPGPLHGHTTWCARRKVRPTKRKRVAGEARALRDAVHAATKPDLMSPWGAVRLRAGLERHASDHISAHDERRHNWPTPVAHLYNPQKLEHLEPVRVSPCCRVTMRDVTVVGAFVDSFGRALDNAESLTYHAAEVEDHRRRLRKVTDVMETLAARRIQRAWRRCVSDPRYAVCTRRLRAEFDDLSTALGGLMPGAHTRC